ncbi:MAG: hypothetical protein KA259_00640 [Caldilineaceae bacterium]|nr:hypothetical protein [Caldilineaceae bacterium]
MSKVQRSEQDRREQLFLVRIWWEPSAATSAGAWRGRVEDVNNGERSYFAAMPDLVAFIDGRLLLGGRRHVVTTASESGEQND